MEILRGLLDVETIVTMVWIPVIINYFNVFLDGRNKSKILVPYLAWGTFWIVDYLFLKKVDSFLIRAIIVIALWTLIGFYLYVSNPKTSFLVAASLYCVIVITELIVAWGFTAIGVVREEMTLWDWIISRLIILIIVLLMNVFIFSSNDRLRQDAAISRENSMYEQQAKIFRQQCEEQEAILQESRKLLHDFKNHLIILKGFNGIGQYDKIDSYIETLINNYTLPYWQSKSGDMIIDSLLSYKMAIAAQSGITIRSEFCIAEKMPFEDYDLCIIVGNILDNAIEAAEKMEKEKRIIEVSMKFNKNMLAMRVSNQYAGDIKTDRFGKLLTIKTDKINHGLGMRAVEKTVEKYDGALTIDKDNGLFRLTIIMYGRQNLSKKA